MELFTFPNHKLSLLKFFIFPWNFKTESSLTNFIHFAKIKIMQLPKRNFSIKRFDWGFSLLTFVFVLCKPTIYLWFWIFIMDVMLIYFPICSSLLLTIFFALNLNIGHLWHFIIRHTYNSRNWKALSQVIYLFYYDLFIR